MWIGSWHHAFTHEYQAAVIITLENIHTDENLLEFKHLCIFHIKCMVLMYVCSKKFDTIW